MATVTSSADLRTKLFRGRRGVFLQTEAQRQTSERVFELCIDCFRVDWAIHRPQDVAAWLRRDVATQYAACGYPKHQYVGAITSLLTKLFVAWVFEVRGDARAERLMQIETWQE